MAEVRHYPHRCPFLTLVDKGGQTYLRVRQATEQGYTDCPVMGCADLAYPDSTLRRARTIGGGILPTHSPVATSFMC